MERVGKYHVERVLARAETGVLYEAEDSRTHRKFALKVIASLAHDPERFRRFQSELIAAARLDHPNIVSVRDLGEDRGQPYIVMELIEGTDLEEVIQNRQPLTVEWKLDVLRQVCEGLGYAHRHGLVHRDLNPANIRVTPGGRVKIMDFGLAHVQALTPAGRGLALGRVHYVAPEQIEGLKVDNRADIFSVGAIAYELISGRRLIEGDSSPDPTKLPRTRYSPTLEAIVMKALAREPVNRYGSVDEMNAALTGLDAMEELALDSTQRAREHVSSAPNGGHSTPMTPRTAAGNTKVAPHSTDFASRLLVAGGGMAGAAFLGGALWGLGGAIALGTAALVLGLFLKHD